MEVSEVVNKFKELVFNDTKTQNIRKTIRNGGSYMDVEDYAKRLAELMTESLEGIPEGTDLVPFLTELGDVQRKYINSAYEVVQKAMNKALLEDDYSDIKNFYRYKVCDSIVELDINDRVSERNRKL